LPFLSINARDFHVPPNAPLAPPGLLLLSQDADRERFLQELEEDPDMRARINIFKDAERLQQIQQQQQAAGQATTAAAAAAAAGARQQAGAAPAGLLDDEDEDEDDGDLPQVGFGVLCSCAPIAGVVF
jgi:hypothetical protein